MRNKIDNSPKKILRDWINLTRDLDEVFEAYRLEDRETIWMAANWIIRSIKLNQLTTEIERLNEFFSHTRQQKKKR